MTTRNDRTSTHGRAVGIAAGLTMAVGGAVTALVLTAGPSIAAVWSEPDPAAEAEVQSATTPSVYVVDGDGNLVAQDGADAASEEPTGYGEYEEADEYDDYEDHEEEYEDDDHDEYEDDDYEDEEYEDDDHDEYEDEDHDD